MKYPKVTYDEEADAMYIYFRKGKISHTKEVSNLVFMDVDSKNEPIGLEIIDVKHLFSNFKKIG